MPTPVQPAPASDEVRELIDLVPDQPGFTFAGLPDHPELRPSGLFRWSIDEPMLLRSSHSDLTWPNDQYPEDRRFEVTNHLGERAGYPYHEDADGNRYFLTGHLWYHQKLYVIGVLSDLAERDPLGAARVLWRFVQAYRGWVPTIDYPGFNRPVEAASTPPHYWWGGNWYRWSTADLGTLRGVVEAFAVVDATTAFDVLSAEVGQDVRTAVVDDMFGPSVDYQRSFPVLHHNMEYNNALGLAALGRGLRDPQYIHEAAEWATGFAEFTFLFDGFFSETTLSYHRQSTVGLLRVVDALQGWTDPSGYESPRSGRRFDDLDLAADMTFLGTARALPNLLVHPDGHYFPIDDTWAATVADDPDLDAGSLLLAAAGVTRLVHGDPGPDQTHTVLAFTPKYGHHQYAPLNLALYAGRQELLPDLGYTHTFYRWWTKSALAHNTVVVDASDMESSGQAEHGGNLEVFVADQPLADVVRSSQPGAYPQTSTYDREVWSISLPGADSYLLDLFRVAGGDRHEYTLHGDANHDATLETATPLTPYGPRLLPEGVEVTLPETENDKGDAEGHYYAYLYVQDVQHGTLADGTYDLRLRTTVDGAEGTGARVLGVVEEGSNELFLGQVPSLRATRLHGTSKDTNDEAVKYHLPKFVLRREGTDLTSTFLTTVEPLAAGAAPRISRVERLPVNGDATDAVAVRVTGNGFVDTILSASEPGQVTADGVTMHGRLAMVRHTDTGGTDLMLVGGTRLTDGADELVGAGTVAGTITAVRRRATGDDHDGFLVDVEVPGDLAGRTMVVTHPDGKTHGYQIGAVAAEGTQWRVELSGSDPGFRIGPDGDSALVFHPFTAWTGEHSFIIDSVAHRTV